MSWFEHYSKVAILTVNVASVAVLWFCCCFHGYGVVAVVVVVVVFIAVDVSVVIVVVVPIFNWKMYTINHCKNGLLSPFNSNMEGRQVCFSMKKSKETILEIHEFGWLLPNVL